MVQLSLEDQNVFVYLIERYEKKLTRYINRIFNSTKEDIEDLLQDIFIKVYKNLNGFDQSLKFSSWIYRIAHNETISHFRRNKARPNEMIGEENEKALEKLVSEINHEDEIHNKYLNKNINTILNKIDIKYREVLILKYFEEKDYKEISDILKKPMGTIATLLNRAKKEFKKELETTNIKF